MTCRIDLPPGELRDFSPNFGFFATLLEALVPDQISGTARVVPSSSGVQLEFIGACEWAGTSLDSEIIPRWMFAEVAFRELISRRVQEFLELLEQIQPSAVAETGTIGWLEAWTAG